MLTVYRLGCTHAKAMLQHLLNCLIRKTRINIYLSPELKKKE